MNEFVFAALLLMAVYMGYALGWCFGTTWQLKRLLPELHSLRGEVSKLKVLARLKGVDLD